MRRHGKRRPSRSITATKEQDMTATADHGPPVSDSDRPGCSQPPPPHRSWKAPSQRKKRRKLLPPHPSLTTAKPKSTSTDLFLGTTTPCVHVSDRHSCRNFYRGTADTIWQKTTTWMSSASTSELNNKQNTLVIREQTSCNPNK